MSINHNLEASVNFSTKPTDYLDVISYIVINPRNSELCIFPPALNLFTLFDYKYRLSESGNSITISCLKCEAISKGCTPSDVIWVTAGIICALKSHS